MAGRGARRRSRSAFGICGCESGRVRRALRPMRKYYVVNEWQERMEDEIGARTPPDFGTLTTEIRLA